MRGPGVRPRHELVGAHSAESWRGAEDSQERGVLAGGSTLLSSAIAFAAVR